MDTQLLEKVNQDKLNEEKKIALKRVIISSENLNYLEAVSAKFPRKTVLFFHPES